MRTLGILWILYGLERFVVALAMFLCIPTLTVMWGALLTRVPNPFTLMDLFHFFLIFAIILAVVAGVISILAGLALTVWWCLRAKTRHACSVSRPGKRTSRYRPGCVHAGCSRSGQCQKRLAGILPSQLNADISSHKSATRGMLSGMGNKDRRSREVKKPKKKIPKFAPPRRDSSQPTHVISTVTNPEKPPTGSQ